MACSNIYDWASQSTKHESYTYNHFPVTGELVATSAGYNDFMSLVNELDPTERAAFNAEQTLWWREYGNAWDKLGCPEESDVGEHTGSYGLEGASTAGAANPTISDVKKIQQALLSKGFNPGKIDGIWGPNTCAAAYKYNRERRIDYSSTLSWEFFADLNFGNATSESYASKFGESCVKWYTVEEQQSQSDLVAIQKQLMAKGYNPGRTDGVWDTKCCTALLAFQHAEVGPATGAVLADTYFALGFSEPTSRLFASLYGSLCTSVAINDPPASAGKTVKAPVGEAEPPVSRPRASAGTTVPTTPATAAPAKAGFPWWIAAVVVGGAAIGAIVMSKRGSKGKSKARGRKGK